MIKHFATQKLCIKLLALHSKVVLLALHGHRGFEPWVWVVVGELKVCVGKVFDPAHCLGSGVKLQPWKRFGAALQLDLALVHVGVVDVDIAHAVGELAWRKVTDVRQDACEHSCATCIVVVG